VKTASYDTSDMISKRQLLVDGDAETSNSAEYCEWQQLQKKTALGCHGIGSSSHDFDGAAVMTLATPASV